LQPDIVVLGDRDSRGVAADSLLLAVEVLSPSTHRKDAVFKRSKYEDSGVAGLWIIDPETPSITAFDLVGGHFELAGEAIGESAVTLNTPFAVTVTPSALVES